MESNVMDTRNRIEEPEVERTGDGRISAIRFAFGPHYFVQVDIRDGKATLCLGATHHGIAADASEVNGELERFVEELRSSHPDRAF
jgi:hypothetical protein